MMTVTALFATSGATNAGLYPAPGLCEEMSATRPVPAGDGLASSVDAPRSVSSVTAVARDRCSPSFFDLSAIASIGSVIALVVFTLITVGHIRVRSETGASVVVLVIAVTTTVAVLVAFVFTTLVEEPATAVTLVVITAGSIVVDAWWKRKRAGVDGGDTALVPPA